MAGALWAQPVPLTLEQARQAASAHPLVVAAQLTADASKRLDNPYWPTLNGHFSGALANPNARIAAGQLTNPFVISRVGIGITLNQVLWDFGRGVHTRASQRLAAESARQQARQTQAEQLLAVEQAYWRLWELGQNPEADADAVSIAQADLCEALGRVTCPVHRLVPDAGRLELEADSYEGWLTRALASRPDLLRLRAGVSSTTELNAANSRHLPTLSLLGAAGLAPLHRNINFADKYAIGTLNFTMPAINTNRIEDGNSLAQAASAELRAAEVHAAHQVRIAWIEAQKARRDFAAKVTPATEAAFRIALAKLRFEAGQI